MSYFSSTIMSQNNQKELPIAITSLNENTENRTGSCQLLGEDEPMLEYNERQNTPYNYEPARNLNMRHSMMNRTNNNGISHPVINTNPITQHGAVKAVNIFGTLHKEPLRNMTQSDKSAVIHPIFSKGREGKQVLSFQRSNKSKVDTI